MLVDSEDQEQAKFVVFLKKNNILHYAVPNGGKRNWKTAITLQRTGVVAGVPDLVIPMAKKNYHGLYIEMKRKNSGVVSDQQAFWNKELNKQGYLAVICYGCDAAIEIVTDYFS